MARRFFSNLSECNRRALLQKNCAVALAVSWARAYMRAIPYNRNYLLCGGRKTAAGNGLVHFGEPETGNLLPFSRRCRIWNRSLPRSWRLRDTGSCV